MENLEIIKLINQVSNNTEFEKVCELIENKEVREKALNIVWYSMTLEEDKKKLIELLNCGNYKMKEINFETAKKINFTVKNIGLTSQQVKQELTKIDGYVSVEFYKSLKLDFSNESMEILLAIKHFYKWVHSDDVPNRLWFTPAYFKDTIKFINKKVGID